MLGLNTFGQHGLKTLLKTFPNTVLWTHCYSFDFIFLWRTNVLDSCSAKGLIVEQLTPIRWCSRTSALSGCRCLSIHQTFQLFQHNLLQFLLVFVCPLQWDKLCLFLFRVTQPVMIKTSWKYDMSGKCWNKSLYKGLNASLFSPHILQICFKKNTSVLKQIDVIHASTTSALTDIHNQMKAQTNKIKKERNLRTECYFALVLCV